MKIGFPIRLIVCGVLVALAGSATELRAAKPKPVKIGVLADLSGSWSTLGKNTVAALQIAANQIATATHGRKRFILLVRDTHIDPSWAPEGIGGANHSTVK